MTSPRSLEALFGDRSEEMLKLAGSTIRNVSRGVVGIALVQSFLAGVGFLAAGVPAAGFVQIGPSILVWSWTAMDLTKALIFTAYMVRVGLADNVLRSISHGARIIDADARHSRWVQGSDTGRLFT